MDVFERPQVVFVALILFLPDSWQAVLRLGHFVPTVCHVIPFDYYDHVINKKIR